MVCSASFLGMVAFAAACVTVPANAGALGGTAAAKTLPWSGCVTSIKEVEEVYITDFITQRKTGKCNLEDYVKIENYTRKDTLNIEQSVFSVGVDNQAIVEDTTIRRSELVQIVKMETEGTTLFRGSIMKKEPFKNKGNQYTVMRTESFGIQVDAMSSKIMFVNNGTTEALYESEFSIDTWHHLTVAVSPGSKAETTKLDLYMGERESELVLKSSHEVKTIFTAEQMFYLGLHVKKPDGGVVELEEMEYMSFSSVSVVSAVGGPGGAPAVGPPAGSPPSPGSPRAPPAGSPPTPPAGSPPAPPAGSPPTPPAGNPTTLLAGNPPTPPAGNPPTPPAGNPPTPPAGNPPTIPAGNPEQNGNPAGNPEQNGNPAPSP